MSNKKSRLESGHANEILDRIQQGREAREALIDRARMQLEDDLQKYQFEFEQQPTLQAHTGWNAEGFDGITWRAVSEEEARKHKESLAWYQGLDTWAHSATAFEMTTKKLAIATGYGRSTRPGLLKSMISWLKKAERCRAILGATEILRAVRDERMRLGLAYARGNRLFNVAGYGDPKVQAREWASFTNVTPEICLMTCGIVHVGVDREVLPSLRAGERAHSPHIHCRVNTQSISTSTIANLSISNAYLKSGTISAPNLKITGFA